MRPEQQPQTVFVSPYEGKRNNFHYNVMVVRIGESNPVSQFSKVNARLAYGFGICRASPLGYRHGRHRETRTHPLSLKRGVCVRVSRRVSSPPENTGAVAGVAQLPRIKNRSHHRLRPAALPQNRSSNSSEPTPARAKSENLF